jgi:hypothetical protein
MVEVTSVAWRMWDCIKKPIQYVSCSALIDIPIGVVNQVASSILFHFVHKVGLANAGVDLKKATKYYSEFPARSYKNIIMVSVSEELVFRLLLPFTIKLVSKDYIREREVNLFPGCQVELNSLIAFVASTIIFGVLHLSNGTGFPQVIWATSVGISLGILKEKAGILSSIFAHMTQNIISSAPK